MTPETLVRYAIRGELPDEAKAVTATEALKAAHVTLQQEHDFDACEGCQASLAKARADRAKMGDGFMPHRRPEALPGIPAVEPRTLNPPAIMEGMGGGFRPRYDRHPDRPGPL